MSNNSSKKAARYAEIFGALSNPNRLRIFIKLATCCSNGNSKCGPDGMKSYVGELGRGLGVAPSTVSHHIRELRRAGLIKIKRAGQNVECWTEPRVLEELSEFFRLK